MVTIIGSLNVDFVTRLAAFPEPGETVTGRSFEKLGGGKGANQALASRRAGAATAIAGAVGNDAEAELAVRLVQDAGADVTRIRRSERPTGTAHITVSDTGENQIVVVPGANDDLTMLDAREAVANMRPNEILLLQLEISIPVVREAMVEASRRSICSILNVAPMSHDARELAKLADIVIANESEFKQLASLDVLRADSLRDELRKVAEANNCSVVVTLGAQGVAYFHENSFGHIACPRITPIDTVGAGDTFCGYLAALLEEGWTLPKAASAASTAASLACLKRGAQEAIPHRSTVLCALRD
jgi:ribokinase